MLIEVSTNTDRRPSADRVASDGLLETVSVDDADSTAHGEVNSSLDLVRRAVGAVDGPEVVAGVQRLSEMQVADLAEAVCAELPQPQVVPGEGEAWPLITARASTFTTTSGTRFTDAPGTAGLNLTAAMDPVPCQNPSHWP